MFYCLICYCRYSCHCVYNYHSPVLKVDAFSHSNAYFSLEDEQEEFMRQIDELKENSTKKDCEIDQLKSTLAEMEKVARDPMVRVRKASWMAISKQEIRCRNIIAMLGKNKSLCNPQEVIRNKEKMKNEYHKPINAWFILFFPEILGTTPESCNCFLPYVKKNLSLSH